MLAHGTDVTLPLTSAWGTSWRGWSKMATWVAAFLWARGFLSSTRRLKWSKRTQRLFLEKWLIACEFYVRTVGVFNPKKKKKRLFFRSCVSETVNKLAYKGKLVNTWQANTENIAKKAARRKGGLITDLESDQAFHSLCSPLPDTPLNSPDPKKIRTETSERAETGN